MRHYLEDRWTSVDRGLLERFADLVKCEVAEIFETRPSPFWEAFSEPGSSCHYIPAGGNNAAKEGGRAIYTDDHALRLVSELVKDCAPKTVVFFGEAETAEQFRSLAEDNVVVVGSPKSNRASEYALCKIFGLEAFSPNAATPPPFHFVWHPSMKVEKSTFGSVSSQPKGPCGIWLHEKRATVVADYNPDLEKFTNSRITNGRDCAVVVVMNHRTTSTGVLKKLVVLAGFTKVGTAAAAERLVADFRELEPRNDEPFVWGIVEAVFQKEKGRQDQKIIHTGWRYRSGGRTPINFKPASIHRRGGPRRRTGQEAV